MLGLGLLVMALLQIRYGLSPLRRVRAAIQNLRTTGAGRITEPLPLEVQPLVEEPSRVDTLSFAVIGLVYVFTLVYGLMLRGGRVDRVAAVVQVAGDLVIASVLVFLTGVGDSPFTFTYLLAVISASILLDGRGALVSAAVGALAYASLLVAVKYGWLESPMGPAPLSRQRIAFLLVSNLLALFLIATLAGFLSRQLSAAGGRLSEREADLQKLDNLQRQILACMPSGLITSDAAGLVTFVNRAASTILSFGLLALSGTPALQAFGLTMLAGAALVWLFAPCFSVSKESHHATPVLA